MYIDVSFVEHSEYFESDFTEDEKEILSPILAYYLEGLSPKVNMYREGNGVVLTITDSEGEHTEKIYDGEAAMPVIDNHTLVYENGVMKVNTADVAEKDNTRPITSAATYVIVGNIEALLKTI